MIPLFAKAASWLALSKTRSQQTYEAAEQSAFAERLSRLRYDPPSFNLWQILKTAVVAIPLLIVMLWIGKWWLRESIIAEFRIEQQKIQAATRARDLAEIRRLESDLSGARDTNVEMLKSHMEELDFMKLELTGAQREAAKAGKCGWTPETAKLINDGKPKPAALKIIRRKP